MDSVQYIPAMAPIILTAVSFILLLMAIYFARPWLAGIIGNGRIQYELKLFEKKGATVMHHVLLPCKQGDVIHIDHIVITNAQVIAISTLGYSGEILGSIRSATWIQETPQGRHRFTNPIRHHEAIEATISSLLGTRLKIRTISAFTSGHLQAIDSRDIVPAGECARAMHSAIAGVTTGPKQLWASNILKNVSIQDHESEIMKESAFIARHGNEEHLKIARYIMAGSAGCMLIAITLVVLRLAANQGLL